MDKQAREAREQMKALSGKEKWTNFWYYYKTHVIVGIFVIIVLAFTITECANRIDYDLNISYYSSSAISDEGIEKLKTILAEGCEDINTNGAVDVGIACCFANPDEMSEQSQAVYMKLSAEMAAGDAMVYLVDDRYKEIIEKGYSESADEIFEISSIPEIKEAMGLRDDQKVYWMTKTLYETEKDKENKVLEKKNADSAAKLLKEMAAKSE